MNTCPRISALQCPMSKATRVPDSWNGSRSKMVPSTQLPNHCVVVPLLSKRTSYRRTFYRKYYQGTAVTGVFWISPADSVEKNCNLWFLKINVSPGSPEAETTTKSYRKYHDYVRIGIRSSSICHPAGAETFDIGRAVAYIIILVYNPSKVFMIWDKIDSISDWRGYGLPSTAFSFSPWLHHTRFLDAKVPLLSLSEGIRFPRGHHWFQHKVSIAVTVQKATLSGGC